MTTASGSAPLHDGIPPRSTPPPFQSNNFATFRQSPVPQQGSSKLTQDSRGSVLASTTLSTSLPSPGPTPTSAAPLTPAAYLHPPADTERPRSAASGYRSHLSAATAPPQQPGLVFDHKRTNLTILEFSSIWCRIAHAVFWPLFCFGHIFAFIFLDFNAIYTLVTIAANWNESSPAGWWSLVALYSTLTTLWFIGVFLMSNVVGAGSRVFGNSQKRQPIIPVLLSKHSYNLASLTSYSRYCFLQRCRLSCLSPVEGLYDQRDWKGFICQETFWILQSWATAFLHVTRALILVGILIVFRHGSAQTALQSMPSVDPTFFRVSGQLSSYAYVVLMIHCAWAALNLLVLCLAAVLYVSMSGLTGLLFFLRGRPRISDSNGEMLDTSTAYASWPGWVLRLEQRVECLYGFCDITRASSSVAMQYAPDRAGSPLQQLRQSSYRRDSRPSVWSTSRLPTPQPQSQPQATTSKAVIEEASRAEPSRQSPTPDEHQDVDASFATQSSRPSIPAARPLSTVPRALEAEEKLEAEDVHSPDTSAESPPEGDQDVTQHSSSTGSDSDPGLSTIEERTEISERTASRPLSQVSAARRSSDEPGAAASSTPAAQVPASVQEETEDDSVYTTPGAVSGKSSSASNL